MSARPIAQRSTEVRSGREIVARLAFALYLLALPAGLAALLWGLTRHSQVGLSLGAVGVLVFALLHLFARRSLGFADVLAELKRNPFKPQRNTAEQPASEKREGCSDGSCGRL